VDYIKHRICNKNKFVSMLRGDLEDAIHLYNMGLKYQQHGEWVQSTSTILGRFLDGIIAFTCAQKHDSDEEYWTNIGLASIEKLHKWAKSNEWNFSHKLYLLEAERHVLQCSDEQAVQMYTLAITTARNHRHIHEEGLALERAGCYHGRRGRPDSALRCFLAAKECYDRWGARSGTERMSAKCRQLSR